MLKYKCIYNIVIPVVYNICIYTMHPAGPLGQVTERQFAQRAKVLSDIQSQRVQVELIFTR